MSVVVKVGFCLLIFLFLSCLCYWFLCILHYVVIWIYFSCKHLHFFLCIMVLLLISV